MRLALDLSTSLGRFGLRPERADDAEFLYLLFSTSQGFAFDALPLDPAAKERLIRMQFHAQALGYRATYPEADFAIVELDGASLGRLIVEREGGDALRFVDFALLPERRGSGVGRTVMLGLLDAARTARLKIRVAILWHNEPSLRMCRRLGFVEVGARPPFREFEWRPERVPADVRGAI